MMENGSSGRARPVPFESHDEFLELCALAATNALSAEENERLDRHLAGCGECRETLAQYRAMVSAGVPAATLGGTHEDPFDSDPNWSLEDAEARLLGRLEDERKQEESDSPALVSTPSSGPAGPEKALPPMDSLWRHMWLQSAAALLLLAALGYTAWRMGIDRGARREQAAASVQTSPRALPSSSLQTGKSHDKLAQNEADLRDEETKLAALALRLKEQTARILSLEARNRQAEASLATAVAGESDLKEARDNLARQLATTEASLEQVREQLSDVSAENAGDAVKVIALRRQVADLTRSLDERQQDLARAQVLLDHDRDIRELMGSRDLYIAEVYDVAKNGETKKPFGRVFYTKGKSLIFYAYDLDQQPGFRDSSTIQAWGSRGQDRTAAVNLGIFYEDNAARKCWILKDQNPRVLSGIDAVFVTIEPHGGSTHPSGKPLLYAYLHIEPNHP